MRLFPPTYHHATIGGFVAGGRFGIGSLKYGSVSDFGNILGATVVTMERVHFSVLNFYINSNHESLKLQNRRNSPELPILMGHRV
jgi:FAD/FMN-containing dehydrogenase